MIFALILIIVMLNLLIAFINDSYAKLANMQKAAFLFEKIGLIIDLENSMSKTKIDKWNKELGDKYIFLRQEESNE